jgi:hypothetical protein
MRKSHVHVLLRYPLLALIYLFIGVDLLGYLGVRLVVIGLEWAVSTARYRRARRRLAACTTHTPEYVEAARALDQLMGLGDGGAAGDEATTSTMAALEVAEASHPTDEEELDQRGDPDRPSIPSSIHGRSSLPALRTTATRPAPPSAIAGLHGRTAHFDEPLIRQHIAQLRRHMGQGTVDLPSPPSPRTSALMLRRSKRLQDRDAPSHARTTLADTAPALHPNIQELVACLRSCCKSNLGGIENESLFSLSFSGRR